MRDVTLPARGIPPMLPEAIDIVRALETDRMKQPQVTIEIDQYVHAGIYYRTMFVPHIGRGTLITGVEVKLATGLIISGDVTVFVGPPVGEIRVTGTNRLVQAGAGRKQAFATHADTYVTMTFPTRATTTEQAEREFTDEVDLLTTRRENRGLKCLA